MANLLVTGGAGFIGVNFVYYWLRHHPADRVVVLDALTYAGHRGSLDAAGDNPRFRFVHGDIRNEEQVTGLLRDEAIDTIVHFAAESHVDRSIHGPDAFLDTNILGTHTLLKAARRVWLDGDRPVPAHRFHHVSTDEVYGSLTADDPAFTEQTPYAPNSPYAASKASSDHLVRAYHHTYGLQVTTSNCSNNYGPYQFPEKLIPLTIMNILYGRPIPVYGDGANVRDWLYVEDHCRGIEAVIERGALGETYNIGGNNEQTNIDLVRRLCTHLDEAFENDPDLRARYPAAPPANGERAQTLIQFVTDRPGHDWRYAIDARHIEGTLGFRPHETFDSALQKTVAWYLDNQDWCEAVMSDEYRAWLKQQYEER